MLPIPRPTLTDSVIAAADDMFERQFGTGCNPLAVMRLLVPTTPDEFGHGNYSLMGGSTDK
jgi:hypothetical protein